MMTTAFALLTLMLGSESWREREAADAVLRWARPFSNAVLTAASRSSNPEISRRAAAALVGEDFDGDILRVGFRFQHGKHEVEIWRVTKGRYWIKTTRRGYVYDAPISRAEIEEFLR